jgi:predicted RNA-binding Zn ribbon-like protein
MTMRYGHAATPPAKLAREELCIKFADTVAWRLADHPEDRAATPEKLLCWLAAAGLVEPADAAQISARWKRAPREAAAFLNRAAELREAIYSLLVARIKSGRADARSLEIVNAHLTSPRGPELAATRNGLKWRTSKAGLDGLLGPVAWSAATLLTGPRATKVRQCQDDRGCGWLFLDESRAQNRRWCSMGNCGNLAKSRRHYHRATQAPAARSRPGRTA